MAFLAGIQKGMHTIVFFICFLSYQSLWGFSEGRPLFCNGAEIEDASWGMNQTSFNIFNSNLVETHNKKVSKREKKRRIVARIRANHHQRVHPMPLSDEELAEIIIWAADCTQNDFQVFTGMLEVESYICGDRTGPDGDRGCSMFTSDPINVFKNQMKLPGRKDNHAAAAVGNTMKTMIGNCYRDYRKLRISRKQPGNAEEFLKLFSGRIKGVKDNFLAGNHLHMDILSGALYLKFKSGLAGGYWPNKTPGIKASRRNKGGVNMYNSASNPAAHSRKVRDKAAKVNFVCEEDQYTNDVLDAMCAMEDDVEFCLESLERGPMYDI